MSKRSRFADLRVQLDDAITYGTKKQAAVIAALGLAEAKMYQVSGEIEYFRAQQQILKNNFVTAIEHLDQAIAHNPSDGAAYNDRALCMVELGIIDDAMPYFDKGIAVEPDYATIYHNKGWLLNNIGRHTEAIACFKQALALEPDRAVTYDSLADSLADLGDHAGAITAYEKVLALLKPGQCAGIRKQVQERIRELKKKVL
jgi:tetratricopeptide (TPR) repeat protein